MPSPAELASLIDRLVAAVDLNLRADTSIRPDASRLKISQYRHIDVSHLLAENEDDYFYFADQDCTPDVLWPVNVCLGLRNDDRWTIRQIRTCLPREARGKVRLILPKMLRSDILDLADDGLYRSMWEFWAYSGGHWIDASPGVGRTSWDGFKFSPRTELSYSNFLGRAAIGHALRQRYEWSVSIGRPGSLSWRFATDPTGIRSLFAERDKGESGRRDALRSWVTSHWRQSRSDPDEEIYVRKHLRGGERFLWRGYECEWQPSQFDRDENQRLREERESMGRQAKRTRSET